MTNLTLAMMLALAITNGATCAPQDMGFYSTTMAVVEVDEKANTVTAVDFNGNEWAWFGVSDYYRGDSAAVTLCDNGTPDWIYDDIIIDTRYSGWIDGAWGWCDGYTVVDFTGEN